MAKVIFELEDIKISPNGVSKLNVEIKFEPAKKQDGSKAQELAEAIIDAIDLFRADTGGKAKVKEVNKY